LLAAALVLSGCLGSRGGRVRGGPVSPVSCRHRL